MPLELPSRTRAVPKLYGANQDAAWKIVSVHVPDTVHFQYLSFLFDVVSITAGVDVNSTPHTCGVGSEFGGLDSPHNSFGVGLGDAEGFHGLASNGLVCREVHLPTKVGLV